MDKIFENLLRESNELLRSAYAIALRDGVETNWEAFRSQLKKALEAQHEIIFHEGEVENDLSTGENHDTISN